MLVFSSVSLLAISIFAYVLFGLTGVKVVLGIVFISSPFYLIFNNFELSQGEKLVFSVLLGLTIFPSSAYLLGLVISFRIAILASFALFVCAGIILRMRKKKQH